MADNKNLTVWQKLGVLFGPDKKPTINPTKSYSIDSKELLRTKSKEEFGTEKLQKQQNLYLKNQWEKVDNTLYQQAVFYETTRIASYTDFEAMEFFPEISAALDILMEESTTQDHKGNILQIHSESERVKKVLTDLFYNRLDIHTTLPMWTRNTPVREDSMIPLLNGTEISIKDLSDKIKNGEEVWTYSIKKDSNSIVPGKIIWCDLTRKNSELIRVTLDDGTHIDTTPDHEYMLRDGSYKRADNLTTGQSLMPFYTKKSDKKKDCIGGYEKVYNPNTGKYKFTHSLVSHECVRNLEEEKLIGCQFDTHHIDFNKLNNEPKNLSRLTHSNHFKLHIEHFDKILGSPEVIKKRMTGIDKYLRSDERRQRLSDEMKGLYPKYFEEYNNSELHDKHNEIRSQKMLLNWTSSDFINKTKRGMTIEVSDTCFDYISKIIVNNEKYIGINKLSDLLKSDEEFITLFKENYTLKKDIKKSINPTTLNKVIFRKINKNYFDFVLSIKPTLILDESYIKAKSIYLGKTKQGTLLNHKVVSIVKLEETSDVYCMEVVGPNGEDDRHNFPICSKSTSGLHTRNGVFLSNCKYGDNFIYLDIDDENGIVNCKQLPNIEIERHEGDVYNSINGVIDIDRNKKKGDDLKFVWKNREFEFNSWQIGHFRLLGDDRRLPYGTSVLEKARRIYKQLMLSEDAMLIYRITRAPERRIFKIFVGNIDDKDVEPYVQQIANKFKRSPVVDPKTGQIDLRYNQMANDQDFFIPVRDQAATNPIETLAGASNLSEIADIEYLQKKLFAALRVPKPFLGFESAVGDGKNLALQDIRFTRTVNRIQQSMLQELNKIAIIHLFILGLDEELNNFTLVLNNPSTQAEMLRTEQMQIKMQLYKDSVSDAGNGFAAMSMTRAKKEILNFSNDEIRLDIEQQRLEKAAAAELANTATVITKSGLFDKIDKIYGDVVGKAVAEGGTETPPPIGGDEMGGAMPEPTTPEPMTPEPTTPEPPPATESEVKNLDKLLLERKDFLQKSYDNKQKKYKDNYINKLIESIDPKEEYKGMINENKGDNYVSDNNNKFNNDITNMVDSINNLLNK